MLQLGRATALIPDNLRYPSLASVCLQLDRNRVSSVGDLSLYMAESTGKEDRSDPKLETVRTRTKPKRNEARESAAGRLLCSHKNPDALRPRRGADNDCKCQSHH